MNIGHHNGAYLIIVLRPDVLLRRSAVLCRYISGPASSVSNRVCLWAVLMHEHRSRAHLHILIRRR